jgi:hypothetical protein
MIEDDDGERLCETKLSCFSGSGSYKNAPTRASNLKRHLQCFHPKILDVVNEKDTSSSNNLPTISNFELQKSSKDKSIEGCPRQASVTRFLTTDKVTVTMATEKFKKHLTELVVRNGVALTLFSQPAFPGLNGEMAKKLGVSLERQSIRKLVLEEAKNKNEELQKTLNRRSKFIKMDATTPHRVNYFAINARFVDQNQGCGVDT